MQKPGPFTRAGQGVIALGLLTLFFSTAPAPGARPAASAGDRVATARTHGTGGTGGTGGGFSYGYRTTSTSSWDSDGAFAYAVVERGSEATVSDINGRIMRSIHRAIGSADEDILWFSLDGIEYVVRDPALVAEAMNAVAPIQELGRAQGRLGAAQGRLGGPQGRSGGPQGRLGAQQAELGRRQAELGREQQRLSEQACREIRRIGEKAIATGKAERAPD